MLGIVRMDRCCIYSLLALKQDGMVRTYSKTRLYIDSPLFSGSKLVLPSSQAHYLLNVLRCRVGDHIAVFNGVDGEFSAAITLAQKKQCNVTIGDKLRAQIACPDLYGFIWIQTELLIWLKQSRKSKIPPKSKRKKRGCMEV